MKKLEAVRKEVGGCLISYNLQHACVRKLEVIWPDACALLRRSLWMMNAELLTQWVTYVGIELLWQLKIICDAEVSVDRYWDQAKWVPREAMPWGIQLAFAPLLSPPYISTYWIRCLPSCLYLCPLVNVIFSFLFQLWLTLTGELVKHFQQFEAYCWQLSALLRSFWGRPLSRLSPATLSK